MKNISKFSIFSVVNHWVITRSISHIKLLELDGDLVEQGVFEGANLILY